MYERTLIGLVPPDGPTWTNLVVEEGTALAGPWSPAAEAVATGEPQTISFSSELDPGYYRVLWEDGGGAVAEGPVFYLGGASVEWEPTLGEVASLVWARTKVAGGKQVGTFTDATRPDAATAAGIIRQAVGLVSGSLTASPCSGNLRESARSHAALMASMLIESSFYPEQTEGAGSSFQARLRIWERSLDKLAALVKSNCGGAEGEEDLEGGGVPAGGFDDGLALYGRDYPLDGGW